jgi:phosphoglycerol transferase MdoB-like AlkP superfamily enzyme
MRGFFRKQGIDRFVGSDDYVNPTFKDDVWGVSDRDVFDRANQEFDEAAKKGPFFGAILTLSNHAPFNLPEPLPFERTQNMGDMNKRCDATRYADWAVGRFIEQARQLKYFDNTLFVFVGDHGFHVAPVLSEIHLLYHHVPLLFYAPNLLDRKGVISHEVSCQVNVAPSVLGLLGGDMPQAYWGRNLFSSEFTDSNFAIFKGSGGDRAVGMVRGDLLMVAGTDGQARLWKYDLGFPPSITPIEATQPDLAVMRQELLAYVQCSLVDLTQHNAGVTSDITAMSVLDQP